MRSSFFYERHNDGVAELIKDYLNSVPPFLSEQTAPSTRAAGDAIQDLIADEFDNLLGEWCQKYSSDFARRAMAEVAFRDTEDFYYIVDVKMHRKVKKHKEFWGSEAGLKDVTHRSYNYVHRKH